MNDAARPVYTVTQITEEITELLKGNLGTVSVEGEISGCKIASSGHAYFSLKDESSLLKAIMWRSRVDRLSTLPADGQLVHATGQITVYPPRGDYQLDVASLAQAGVGLLQKKFEELKRKLEEEGLFDPERKRKPPSRLKKVVVITSPGGAAVRDFLRTLETYQIPLEILILPVRVQGLEAPPEIVEALKIAPTFEPDLVILTRGGGSLEDLWAFNEEIVARAIAESPIPVVSAVGHEVDFTIADFVTDVRVPTPTAAAHFLAESVRSVYESLERLEERLAAAMEDQLREVRNEILMARQVLFARSPVNFVPLYRQRIDDLIGRADFAIRRSLESTFSEITSIKQQLSALVGLEIVTWKGKLETSKQRLIALEPAATLGRGFALVETTKSKKLIRSIGEVPKRGDVRVHLQDGNFEATPRPEGPRQGEFGW